MRTLLVVFLVSALAGAYQLDGEFVRQANEAIPVRKVGQGLRWKPVSFLGIRVDVYRAESFLDAAVNFDREEPMKSFKVARAKVMRLHFLRDVEATKIAESLKTSLEENGVQLSRPEIQKLFSQFQFEIKKDAELLIIGVRKSGDQEELEIRAGEKLISASGLGLATDLWKAWYGTPADSGLENLRTELLTPIK